MMELEGVFYNNVLFVESDDGFDAVCDWLTMILDSLTAFKSVEICRILFESLTVFKSVEIC
ncbi:hypothetical protein A2U01_0071337, partial [Trifolium medium]|nr:hypothetical protein [Trifolium medium]